MSRSTRSHQGRQLIIFGPRSSTKERAVTGLVVSPGARGDFSGGNHGECASSGEEVMGVGPHDRLRRPRFRHVAI